MISVRVPATSANLGPGFDCLGAALSWYNYVEIEETAGGVSVEVIGEGKAQIEPEHNLATKAASLLFKVSGYKPLGFRLRLTNEVPISRGLGSSACAIVGGLVAANKVAGEPLGVDELLELACKLEGHPDNVTPALLGGITVSCMEGGKVLYTKIDPPPGLHAVIAVPEMAVATKEARSVLPSRVPLEDAVFNLQRVSLLVAALTSGQLDLMRVATVDRLHQPYREALVPGMQRAIRAALEEGALGATLSGSGPSLVAWCMGAGFSVGEAMCHAFAGAGIKAAVKVCTISGEGASVRES